MKQASDEIKKLRNRAEASLCWAAELQTVLAQIDATLSRKENQKVKEKIQQK